MIKAMLEITTDPETRKLTATLTPTKTENFNRWEQKIYSKILYSVQSAERQIPEITDDIWDAWLKTLKELKTAGKGD